MLLAKGQADPEHTYNLVLSAYSEAFNDRFPAPALYSHDGVLILRMLLEDGRINLFRHDYYIQLIFTRMLHSENLKKTTPEIRAECKKIREIVLNDKRIPFLTRAYYKLF